MKIKFSKKIVLLALLVLLSGGGVAYFIFSPREAIVEYNIQRDKKFILSLFDKDWYWLSGYEREESDTDQFLEKLLPPESADMRYAGKLQIKMMYVKNQPAGFAAYYMNNAYEGILLFIDVAPEFRRHQYGRMLIDYAVEDMRKQGAGIVRLTTRPQNIAAQTLYKRAGFKEYTRDDVYVSFQKRLAS